jgi:hypothetical protein
MASDRKAELQEPVEVDREALFWLFWSHSSVDDMRAVGPSPLDVSSLRAPLTSASITVTQRAR